MFAWRMEILDDTILCADVISSAENRERLLLLLVSVVCTCLNVSLLWQSAHNGIHRLYVWLNVSRKYSGNCCHRCWWFMIHTCFCFFSISAAGFSLFFNFQSNYRWGFCFECKKKKENMEKYPFGWDCRPAMAHVFRWRCRSAIACQIAFRYGLGMRGSSPFSWIIIIITIKQHEWKKNTEYTRTINQMAKYQNVTLKFHTHKREIEPTPHFDLCLLVFAKQQNVIFEIPTISYVKCRECEINNNNKIHVSIFSA